MSERGRPVVGPGGGVDESGVSERASAPASPTDDRRFDARVRQALQAGGIGIWDWDVAADQVSWSDEVLRIFGVTRDGFDGSYASFLALIAPDDRDRMATVIQEAADRLGEFTVEHRIELPDGGERWLLCMGRALGDETGKLRHMTGVVLDVTERRSAQHELERTNRLLEGAQRIAQMGSFEWQGGSDRVVCSTETYRILGMAPDAPIDSPLAAYLERVHPDDREAVEQGIKLGEQVDFLLEHRVVRADDGRVRDVRLEGRMETTVEGRVVRGYGALWDVTDERARERSEKELEQRLVRSRKFEALGQLAGGIAHDFNNLLTAILGNVTLIRRRATQGADPGGVNWVELGLAQIEEAAQRAADLTRQLLTFGKRQAGRADPIDLNERLRSMGDMLRRLIGEHLHLEMDLSSAPAVVRIDTSQLEQVVMNLAINARDAMPEGGLLSIASELVPASEGGEPATVVLRVQDTGVGMPPEVLERIFEPFFTTKELGKGTGLGLATVYGIVEQAGGRCEVRSQPDRGTIFEVDFPAASEPAVTAQGSGATRATGGEERILVCEDERQVLEVTSGILRSAGYHVVEVGDGAEALSLFEGGKGAFDAIVSDVVTPHLGGPELARRLAERGISIPFVFVSGYIPDDPEREGAPLPGPLLAKPFSADALLGAVRDVLEARPPSDADDR